MPTYTAVTESGATYVIDTDARTWTHRGGPVEHLHRLATLKRDYGPGERTQDLFTLPEADKPVVGESLFVWGGHMYDWRLSTDIVSVEVT